MRKQFDSSAKRNINLFFLDIPANRQVLRMISRKICVIRSVLFARFLYQLKIRSKSNSVWINLHDSGFNSWEIWNSTKTQ